MKKKILVVGEHFSENLGDGVIGRSVEYLLQEKFPEAELIRSDLSGRKQFMNTYNRQEVAPMMSGHLISKWIHRNLNKHTLLYALYTHGRLNRWLHIKEKSSQPYDLAVFTGGQLFMDYFSLPIHQYMKELAKQEIPTIFNSCGMGRVNSKWLHGKLKRALSQPNIHSVTVRDHLDPINEKLLPENLQAVQSYDCAMWSKEAFDVEKKDSSVIGLGVISLSRAKDKAVISLYTDIIRQLNAQGIAWELFCNGSYTDYELAVEIARISGYDKSVIAKRPLDPSELVETIATYRSIISFRLHSHVIAVSLDVPSVAIVWDDKVDFFFESIQREDRLFYYDSKAEDVLRKLFEAENEGYDTELVQAQKNICQDSLVAQINYALAETIIEEDEKTPLSEFEA